MHANTRQHRRGTCTCNRSVKGNVPRTIHSRDVRRRAFSVVNRPRITQHHIHLINQ